ncbi:MAG: hypothetical protein HC905_31040 [Bacteroidales bacterium]|nr:hypothetical protein [Bacteroidales bacterium]
MVTCGKKYLANKEIQTLFHYPITSHKQIAYKEWSHLVLPITEQIRSEILNMPMSPVLSQNESQLVVNAINSNL